MINRDGHANEFVFSPILVVHWVQILMLFGCQIRFELSGTVSKIGYFLTILLIFCLLSNSSLAPLYQPFVWSSWFLMVLWKHCKGNFIWIPRYYKLWTKLFAQITGNKSDGRKQSSKQKTLLSKSNLWELTCMHTLPISCATRKYETSALRLVVACKLSELLDSIYSKIFLIVR